MAGKNRNQKQKKTGMEALTLEEEMVYKFCCTENEAQAEDILQQSSLPVVKLTMILLRLQLKGYIKETGPGRYVVIGQ